MTSPSANLSPGDDLDAFARAIAALNSIELRQPGPPDRQDDPAAEAPAITVPAPEPSARVSLIRGLVFYSAMLVGDLAGRSTTSSTSAWAARAISPSPSSRVIGLLLAYQVWTHVLDLALRR